MTVNEHLYSKNGRAVVLISKELLKYSIGDKIPTVSDLSVDLKLVRATVHIAIKNLISIEAIEIESRGQLGSFLVRKNTKLLLECMGIKSIVGAMPLPYTKRYEGLASGLITSMENSYNIPVNLAYMRGAMSRISMVLQKRYDFAVVSRFAAEKFQEQYQSIDIVLSFGTGSFLGSHVVMFSDLDAREIKDGMKIGIDNTSLDQKVLTERVCAGKTVNYINMEYSNLIEQIRLGSIDATVMNIDEVIEKHFHINYQPIPNLSTENTEAVIVVSKEAEEIRVLLKEFVSIETVLNIQKMIMEGKITPNY